MFPQGAYKVPSAYGSLAPHLCRCIALLPVSVHQCVSITYLSTNQPLDAPLHTITVCLPIPTVASSSRLTQASPFTLRFHPTPQGTRQPHPPPTGTERTSLRKEHRCRDHRRGVSLFIPPGSKPPRSGLLNKGTLLRVGLPLICSRVRPQFLVLHLLKLDFIRRHVLCFTITLPALTVSAALF